MPRTRMVKVRELADARDVVEFLDYLLEYLYNLPKSIADYRERHQRANDDS